MKSSIWTTIILIVISAAIGYYLSIAANKKLLENIKLELEKLKMELK